MKARYNGVKKYRYLNCLKSEEFLYDVLKINNANQTKHACMNECINNIKIIKYKELSLNVAQIHGL